jgi:Zn-dependent protease with chaperone function
MIAEITSPVTGGVMVRRDKNERWDDFHYQFLQSGWFDDDRAKTVEAMRRLSERMPEEIFDELPIVIVLAPAQWKYGQVYPSILNGVVVYLSPTLEKLEQEEVDFTVAHEFAHVHLGHQVWSNNPPSLEDEADKLVESWGFTVPERRKTTVATA